MSCKTMSVDSKDVNKNVKKVCSNTGILLRYLFSLRLVGSAMFGATFKLVTRVGLP